MGAKTKALPPAPDPSIGAISNREDDPCQPIMKPRGGCCQSLVPVVQLWGVGKIEREATRKEKEERKN
jgi:hypothetical protein